MNHCNSKKCVMLELTELTTETAPAKLINGNAVHAIDSRPIQQRQNHKARKRMATIGSVFLVVALLTGLIVPFALQLRSSSLLEARLAFIRRVLLETPLVDGHWSSSGNISDDISTLHNSLVAAHFWPVLVPCGAQFLDAVQLTLEKVDEIQRIIHSNSDRLELIDSADALEQAHLAGRVAILLGVEGGHTLGDSLGVLRSLYLLGTRYLTITHTCNTAWAETAETPDVLIDDEIPNRGLANFGKVIIKEMNRLGMIVDLSHVSEKTMHDVLTVSRAPVIFSHSGAQALCNGTTNVPDSVLARLAMNGGIVMVNVRGCPETTLEQVITHINYIRTKTGVSHIGLGWDSDKEYPFLLAELARDRHWGTAAIRKLVGENLIRVFREIESVRNSLQNVAEPAEDIIPAIALDGKTYCRYPGV
ncbi:uncharacterized protein CBL_11696 [Carabus blaptoides fortunei]